MGCMLKQGSNDSSSMGGLAGPPWTHPRCLLMTRSAALQAEVLSSAGPQTSLTKKQGVMHCRVVFSPPFSPPWPCRAGYGFCRSHIQMFDPGFNGPKARGPEDEGTADFGGDPVGVLTR